VKDVDPELWLTACRAAADAASVALSGLVTRADREQTLGRGEGGDETVAVDRAAENAVVAELERLHAAGHSFTLVSEELGIREFGQSDVHVVVDPVDGSANAKRAIPFYSLSIAVASGPTLGEVEVGYVKDFSSGEEWTAVRGDGARLNGEPLRERPKEEIEILSLEATLSSLVADHASAFVSVADRLRIMGSCALSLCHFAAGRVDAVCTLRPIRCVDIAAAQLLAVEQDLAIQLADGTPLKDAPLDLAHRSRVVAAARSDTSDHLARTLRRIAPANRSNA
jgi:myo-inositol-1(or 4)-monophosphatase